MEIKLKNIYKNYGTKLIFEDVSLTFPSGRCIGLIGPNGIGKTTLIRMLFNLDSEYQGDIYFDDYSNKNVKLFEKAYYMQDYQTLYFQLTGYDHLKFLSEIHQINEYRIHEIVNRVGMSSYIYKTVESYSLGMKQHLLIAMALLTEPECIVMDEPFNGLDPTSMFNFKELLMELKEEGKTLIISSHNLSIIETLVDEVYLIKNQTIQPVAMNHKANHEIELIFNDLEDQQYFIKVIQDNNLRVKQSDEGIIILDNFVEYLNLLVEHQLTLKNIQYHHLSVEELYKEHYIN